MANTAALTLDGTGDYAKRGADDASLDLTSAWTIEGWFRPMDAGGWNVDTYNLISKGSRFDRYTPFSMDIYYNDLRVGYRDNWTTYEATYNVSSLSTSVFHHFAATYSANEIKIYVNGTLEVTESSLASAPQTTDKQFCVGAYHDGGTTFQVTKACKIDEVRVWSVLRTGTEISDYKDLQAAGNETGLVACYHFNSAATDATSNALNLTLVGDATYDTGDYPTLTDAGGGSNYNQSAAGTMGTLSATLVLRTGKALSGVTGTYSATLAKVTGKSLSGSSGSSGAELTKRTTKSFTGAMGDLSATVNAIKTALVAVSGTAGDLTGSITRQVNKALAGVSGSVSGTLARLTSKSFSGSDGGLSGALNTSAGKFVELAGTVGYLAGALARQTLKSLSGATDTVSGAISKQINKALSATSGSISGTLSSSVYKVVELAGAAGNLTGTLTRSIAKSLAGTVGSVSGSIAKAISKSFSGTMGALSGSFTTFAPTEYLQSITGSISSITGSVTMAMVFRRAKMKAGYAIRSIINGGRRLTD